MTPEHKAEGTIEVGDTVRLRWAKRTAVVEVSYPGSHTVRLSRCLRGVYSWNVEDLVLVKKGGKA